MRYETLNGPLEGWTYDENGTTYTASGYLCSAQTLESALWLFECFIVEGRRYLIRSDEAPGTVRPLYELSDADATGTIQPPRLRTAQGFTGENGVAARAANA